MQGFELVGAPLLVLGGSMSNLEPIVPIHIERPFPHLEDDDVYEIEEDEWGSSSFIEKKTDLPDTSTNNDDW